jgi:hypothetical protein
MNRLEKCITLKEKGYTYDKDTGKIYGTNKKEIQRKSIYGYISIGSNHFKGDLKGHHFAYFMVYDNVDFIVLDHINQIRHDNRICNLRTVNYQQNSFNTNAKGYTFDKKYNKWRSRIMSNNKSIHLGYFDTEEEAKKVYLEAKKNYHLF